MNKVCLVLSLGLLMTSTQQIFCSALELAERAHAIAKKEYNDAVNKLIELKKSPWTSKEIIEKADEDRRLKYYKSEKTAQDLAVAKALQVQLDATSAQQLQATYDAPPSYAQATAPDSLAHKVIAAKALVADINHDDKKTAKELVKELNQKYNPSNGWFGF